MELPFSPNGPSQHLCQALVHPAQVRVRDVAGPAVWPDSGLVQGLVRIDVAHPGNDPLVQKQGLDARPTVPHAPGKDPGLGLQWLGAKGRIKIPLRKLPGCGGTAFAEFAGVVEYQTGSRNPGPEPGGRVSPARTLPAGPADARSS